MSDKELKFIYKEPDPPRPGLYEWLCYGVGIVLVFGLMYLGGR